MTGGWAWGERNGAVREKRRMWEDVRRVSGQREASARLARVWAGPGGARRGRRGLIELSRTAGCLAGVGRGAAGWRGGAAGALRGAAVEMMLRTNYNPSPAIAGSAAPRRAPPHPAREGGAAKTRRVVLTAPPLSYSTRPASFKPT